MPVDLTTFVELARQQHGLVVVSTVRADSTIQSSLVNAGMLPDPASPATTPPEQVIAFVTAGRIKLENLRARPQLTVIAYAGWRWAAVEGRATVVGPDDPHPAIGPTQLPGLLRAVFTAAGGTHDDWDAYDRVMAEERRAVVLISPTRTYGV